jgi:GNAT superfamily N-acetyltransferase
VAEQASRVAAAAHLLRYFPDERAGAHFRDAGQICWLLFWPQAPAGNPCWPDATAAAEALMAACAAQFGSWGVSRQYASGDLPVPGVYGVPEQWPHVAGLYQQAGFSHTGHSEVVYLIRVEDLPAPASPPLGGLKVRRSVGINGVRLSAVLGPEVTGYIEIEILDEGERLSRHGGWADIGNLHVAPPYQRQGVGTWLLGQAADWLRLAEVSRLLTYAWQEGTDPGGLNDDAYRAFLAATGFRELTRTARGWTRK